MNAENLLLVIMDGFAFGEDSPQNAISCAKTPFLDNIFKACPTALLAASGESVGLPEGQMGNSEVGHTNMGAGRVVYQDLTYINKIILNGDFFNNDELNSIMNYVEREGSSLHLMGLVSNGGVHSHLHHLYALLKLAKMRGVTNVCIHAWMDGRDTSPNSGKEYIKNLEEFIFENKIGEIKTVCGRFYAMDRDLRLERTQEAYNAIVNGLGEEFESANKAVLNSYEKNITDEFIEPSVKKGYSGVKENDAVICFNFRPDRARQITRMFMDKEFASTFVKKVDIKKYCCFTQYDKDISNVNIAFKPREIKNTLGEYLSKLGFSQLRVAETEKYAHVTFFFNGGIEKSYKGEERIIIDSPKVKTYDLKPEMSAHQVTGVVLKNIELKKYNLIVVNFANPDMVGHTGNFKATVKAVEIVSDCVEKLISKMNEIGGVSIITADHGNAEKMLDENKNIFTAHTSNQVPFSVVGYPCVLKKHGALCDIAPTVLEILGLRKPSEMTGNSLIL